jgi:hypothetical protein
MSAPDALAARLRDFAPQKYGDPVTFDLLLAAAAALLAVREERDRAQHEAQMLRFDLDTYREAFIDGGGVTWLPPTAEAYEKVCVALEASRLANDAACKEAERWRNVAHDREYGSVAFRFDKPLLPWE